MALNRLGQLPQNTTEDFLDELSSAIVYDEGQEYIKKIKESVNTGNKYVDEALQDALTGAVYQIMNEVVILVTEYALLKAISVLSGCIAYIKGRSAVQKFKGGLKNFFARGKTKGNVVGKALGVVGSAIFGSEQQTIAIAKMTNDTANNVISSIGQERQNQILIKNNKMKRVDDYKSNMYSTFNQTTEKKTSMFMDKLSRGKWENTTKDKKLYFEVTGQDSTKVKYNSSFVSELNKYSQFVTTMKGDIISTAKSNVDLLAGLGVSNG